MHTTSAAASRRQRALQCASADGAHPVPDAARAAREDAAGEIAAGSRRGVCADDHAAGDRDAIRQRAPARETRGHDALIAFEEEASSARSLRRRRCRGDARVQFNNGSWPRSARSAIFCVAVCQCATFSLLGGRMSADSRQRHGRETARVVFTRVGVAVDGKRARGGVRRQGRTPGRTHGALLYGFNRRHSMIMAIADEVVNVAQGARSSLLSWRLHIR